MTDQAVFRTGLVQGFAAYLIWGAFPVYFALMAPASSLEVICHRILWSFLVYLILIAVTRTWRPLLDALRTPRTFGLLALAGALISINWLVYIFAVLTDHVVDASLGYFINPLVTVALAVVFLHERLRPAQWVSLGIGLVAVIVITLGYGRVPWISLVLALSFGLYSLVKNRVGRTVAAVPGLAIETGTMAPFALAYLIFLQVAGQSTFAAYGFWHAAALMSAGVVTAAPLMLFNGASRRLPLNTIGSLQYLTPVLQFLLGVLVFHEQMAPARWWGFALVWCALIVSSVDSIRQARMHRSVLARVPRQP